MQTSRATAQSEGKSPVNRLLKILANFSVEVESFEEDVEFQIQDAISSTEARLKALAAEQLQHAVGETKAAIRTQVTRELLDRFVIEIDVLKAELEQRHREELKQFKADVEEKESAIVAAKREKELMEQERQAEAAQWSEERDRLNEGITKATRLKIEWTEKFKAAEAQWNDERKERKGQHVRSPDGSGNESVDFSRAEVSRVTSLLEALAKVIEDPSTDLPAGMRTNRQQTELKAYLKGLRFALGEVEV